MIDLSQRSQLPELMDQPGVSENEITKALKELAIVNQYLGGYSVILKAMNQVTSDDKDFKILDLGCGGGDILRKIHGWAVQKQKKVHLTGLDINPQMTRFASQQTGNDNIKYITLDVFDDRLFDFPADIILCSLFCHHLSDSQLVDLLVRMKKLASTAIIINDLHRHKIAYHAIKILTRLFSKTHLVIYDAPLSVARSFSRKDWEGILNRARITNYSLNWQWAWRWSLIINTNQ